MRVEDALSWVRGERSHTNTMQQVTDPAERAQTLVDVERADAATTERAYWVLKAHTEGLGDIAEAFVEVYEEAARVAAIPEGEFPRPSSLVLARYTRLYDALTGSRP